MKERIQEFAYGNSLVVYPFLSDDAPDHWMGSAAHIEATHHPGDRVNCNVYFSLSEPLTREQWKQLFAAVERGWRWLDETKESR